MSRKKGGIKGAEERLPQLKGHRMLSEPVACIPFATAFPSPASKVKVLVPEGSPAPEV